jgi:hypothetical protein
LRPRWWRTTRTCQDARMPGAATPLHSTTRPTATTAVCNPTWSRSIVGLVRDRFRDQRFMSVNHAGAHDRQACRGLRRCRQMATDGLFPRPVLARWLSPWLWPRCADQLR